MDNGKGECSMSVTLERAVVRAHEKGYDELADFLQSHSHQIKLKRISNIAVLDDWKVPSADGATLYFGLDSCRGKEITGNILCFDDREKMYAMAYQLLDIVNESDREWNEKVIETNLKFNNITLKDPDVMKMIIYFNEIMKNPVIIYDEFFNITVITHDYLEEYDRQEHTIEKIYMRNLYYYKQRVTFLREDAPVKECTRLLFPVIEEKMPKGYLAIFDIETAYEEMDMMILEIFANAVLVEMKRLLQIQNVEKKFISDFLYDLIYRKTDKEAEINRRASLLNMSREADYCMITINPLGEISNPRFDTNGYVSQYEFLYDRVMNHIQNFHNKHFEQDIVSKFDNATYVLHKVNQEKGQDKKAVLENIKRFSRKISKMLEERFDGMVFQIGIGEIVTGIGNISNSFWQSWTAISYGEILHGQNEGFIVSYNDNSLLKLFGRLKETDTLDEIIPSSLIKLRQYDERYNSQLYVTLKMYLDCNCNAKKTAENLYIHYKTVLYRLDKIKNYFDIDLENSNSRLYIELGIQFLDLKEAKKSI